MQNQDSPTKEHAHHEERMARVIWAAHILSYLIGERSDSRLVETELESGEDFDDDELDAGTERAVIFTGSDISARLKFLDCLAELLSPSKGWDHVIATGLRESEDFVEIDIARNDRFAESRHGGRKLSNDYDKIDTTQYITHLQEYLASSSEHGDHPATSPSWFEHATIEYNRERTDEWIENAKQFITLSTAIQNHKRKVERHFLGAAKAWTKVIELVNQNFTEGSMARQQIVQAVYEYIVSVEAEAYLLNSFGDQNGSKVWRALRLLARPVSNCRLLMRIASRLPNFRTVKICRIPFSADTKISNDFKLDITEAWSRLDSTASHPELQTIAPQKDDFRKDCSKSIGSHAEVQLLLHYQNSPFLTPTIDYFGCSKKICLLCEGFLQGFHHPISTRGRHGLCYPTWAVPFSTSKEVQDALERLENMLVSRIKIRLNAKLVRVSLKQVPQSSVVSDFSGMSLEEVSRRQETRRTAEESQKSLQRELHLLDGKVSRIVPTASAESVPTIEPYNSCVMCKRLPAKLCNQCKSCYYCSAECQKSDWSCHRLLCKALSTQTARPSPAHKRAILFPDKDDKPLLIWVLCHRKASSEYEGLGILVEYETANVRALLGDDNPYQGTSYIERNPRRDRNLGFGISSLQRMQGYSIVLTFRDAFLKDGSTLNRSILASAKTSGTVSHTWRGPLVAMRENCKEFYDDVTLADFRHIIDYFVTYNTTEVREITSPQPQKSLSKAVQGVKICCFGEIKLHGSEPYVAMEVPEYHPIRSWEFSVSSISKRLGIPIRMWKFPDIESWIDPPGWDENLCAESNPDAAFLMMGSDPKKDSWGWAPLYWNVEIGNVLVIRDGGGDLSVDELRLMCYFVRRKLQPMFADAMGTGLVSRTKQEVLKFITRENMEKCKDEMAREISGAFRI